MGYEILYSDTDSVFFELKSDNYDDMIKEVEAICEYLNKQYIDFCKKFNSDKHEYLRIEPDKIYERWMQGGSKKRYAGVFLWKDIDMRDSDFDDRLEVKGFEMIRGNSADISGEVQKKLFKLILTGQPKKEIREYLNKLRKEVFGGERDLELGKEAESKPLSEYTNIQAHVKAFIWANENGYELEPGDPYIWWYDESGQAKGIPLFQEKVSDNINVDYNKMWNLTVVRKIAPILECIVRGKFNMSMFLEGKSQKRLFGK